MFLFDPHCVTRIVAINVINDGFRDVNELQMALVLQTLTEVDVRNPSRSGLRHSGQP